MKKIFIVFVFILAAFVNANAQNKPGQTEDVASWGFAPAYTGNANTHLQTELDPTSIARGINNTGAATSIFGKWVLNNPAGFSNINAALNRASFCGGLGPDGFFYAIDNGPPVTLIRIDTATGIATNIAAVTGTFGTEGWTELAYDYSTSTWYGATGSATGSSLYTFNVTTGVATRIGAINTGLVITIGIHPTTNIMYGIDIVTDNLITINKTTAVGTDVGPIGFNSNFGAGSAFDNLGVYYFAGIDAGAGNARNFYTMNLTTGAGTLVGAFPATAQVSSMGLVTSSLPPLPLNPFALQNPVAGTRIVTQIGSSTPVTISWDTSSRGATYKFVFGSPTVATRRLTIDNGGSNTITTTLGALDVLLASNGFTNNGSATDSAVGEWTVWAKKGTGASGPDSLSASNGPRSITFRRGQLTLGPLNQDFASTTFPPPLWALEGGGTMYWARNAVGGYQVGSGSAKYDYYSAQTTTPLQSLVSQEFLPVTSPTNYLRFNYSHAGYVFTTTGLGPDSCIIETSTNNGATWTVLLRMGASTTPVGGYNSSTVMSTQPPMSTGAYTPSTAAMWATKILLMPVGTNKVKFTAKSGYGNNLYIDDITSGTMTGTQTPITLTPEKYELSQNYPNPFNPSTSIKYSVPVNTLVTLKIYNTLGKEVATLVNETKPAGSYEINFNAANLASGVYYYKIEAGSFSEIKKMLLIK